jgi:hypothetical protein
MENRYVVGTESAETTVAADTDLAVLKPVGVWHAVELGSHKVACGAPDLHVFEDIPWEAKRTSVLCQRCLRAIASW